jgi:hypothetical protein
MDIGPFTTKHVEQGALLCGDEGNHLGRHTIERDLGDKRLGHRVLVSHIVLEQLGCQGPEVVVVHGLIAS